MLNRILWLCLLLAPPLQAGEVYRWVDNGGGVHYSDQPPPLSAKQSKTIKGKGNIMEVDKESFETKRAREKNPVILYSTNCGPVCDQADEYLQQRGIPFTLKDPAKILENAVELKKLIGAVEVPVIMVGKAHRKGFDTLGWNELLDQAGYPNSPLIPHKPAPASPNNSR
jgi:glutaredoxin